MTTFLKRLIAVCVTLFLLLGGIALAATPAKSSQLVAALRAKASRAAASTLVFAESAEEEEGEEGETEPNSPGPDWLVNQRAGKSGSISVHAYSRALRQAKAAERRTIAEAPDLAAAEWQLMGPTNIGGRVNDVAVDPTLPDTVYAATAGGGVWKSTDAGAHYAFSWPDDITQTMGAIATGSDGVIYAGTGESNPGGGSITYGGTGMYRSVDHGESWEFVGLRNSGSFGRIAVDPTNPQRVFAAAAGNLYKPGGERGLYLSEDGGDHWRRVLDGLNQTSGAIDVSIDPQNPNNVLAAFWDHQRLPSHRIYTGVGSLVYRSTDGGETWSEIPIPHGIAAADVGRIGVAFAPSSPSRAYAIVANKPDGTGVGFFSSDDGGATFTKTAASAGSLSQSSYGWWFGRIYVDPDDAQRVWITGLGLARSTNGGAAVSTVSGPHSDQHGMAWDPNVPNRVYLANDGGMYRSDNDGNNWTAATSQGWTQSYSVDVGELTPSHIVTGLQDNGCIKSWNVNEVGPDKWTSYGGCGDGLETLINPTHEQTMYACSQYGACSVAPAGAPAGVPIVLANPPGAPADRKGWWTPMIFDPINSNTMYFGTNKVHRSLNGGLTYTPISGDLTRNETQLDPNLGYRIRHVVTAIAASKSDPNVFWSGSDDGLLWKSTDLALPSPTWTEIQSGVLPADGWVTRVTIDPANANVVYVTYSGYRAGDDAGHVFKTTDGGATWTDVTGDLPEAPVNDLLIVGNQRIVSNDVGVFVTTDDEHYYKLGLNLPAVPVIEMRYHAGTNTITAATFGHGIQRITLP
ncbi:MAG: hypothetical protein QOG54_2174 [Actinomycetota bacterium]|jgi:photosystem II stability/assembly factor-like uncharacterized protein|nr:hypothetical protein [Actinomycetota bacterium]